MQFSILFKMPAINDRQNSEHLAKSGGRINSVSITEFISTNMTKSRGLYGDTHFQLVALCLTDLPIMRSVARGNRRDAVRIQYTRIMHFAVLILRNFILSSHAQVRIVFAILRCICSILKRYQVNLTFNMVEIFHIDSRE